MQLSTVSYKTRRKGGIHNSIGLKLNPVFFLTLTIQFYDRTQKMLTGVTIS